MADREQIRRDAERASGYGGQTAGILAGHVLAVIAELEQAEREREEWRTKAHALDGWRQKAWSMAAAEEEQDAELDRAREQRDAAKVRANTAEARLAKVPALVEALEKIASAQAWYAPVARDALAAYEQEQGVAS